MSKIENNKNQKLNSILSAALSLFTTQGVSNTSIAEISEKSGIAKGTFYLYFKDKYDIRNRLIYHESSKLFKEAHTALQAHLSTNQDTTFEDKIIFIIEHIINFLNENKSLLTFISKNLSWGVFKDAIVSSATESDDEDFITNFYKLMENDNIKIKEPEIMLYLITELVSSSCYSAILYNQPSGIDNLKPYLFTAVKNIISGHII